ncbi:MAG: AAA family ATPase [Deltaproteobacteria bacterium]|nr:AAA family ATPase [Deltaproteobacteria bacterium]
MAGGNGAGKTTFYEHFLAPRGVAFVNADNIARRIAPAAPEASSYEAARIAERIRYDLLRSGASFCFETVFSHPSKIDFLAKARALDYEIVLVFIRVQSPQLNLARVAQRVRAGGHGVPDEKVLARLERSEAYVRRALPLVDEALFFDNSSSDDPFRHVATLQAGAVTLHQDPVPTWISDMLRTDLP